MAKNIRLLIGSLKIGDRIRLVSMLDDPDPIAVGKMGTVHEVTVYGAGESRWCQIDVSWDDGRTLMLVSPPDVFDIIDGER